MQEKIRHRSFQVVSLIFTSPHFWNILFSFAIALNLINYYSLDLIFSFLFIGGVLISIQSKTLKEKINAFLSNFFLKPGLFNYFVILYLSSGIVGYATASPMGHRQWEDILGLRWVLGFYAFYFAGRKLKHSCGKLSFIAIIPLLPSIVILVSQWRLTGGLLISSDYRLQGFYQNPNHFALAILLPWAFLLGQIAVMNHFETKQTLIQNIKSSPRSNFLVMKFTLILLAAISIMLIASFSRTAWTGALMALLISIFYIRNRKFKISIALLILILATCVSLNVAGLRNRLLYSFDLSAQSAQSQRIIAWKASWQIFLDHPLFGVGFAENSRLFRVYYDKLGFVSSDVVGNPHNQYLEVLSGAGIFGFIGYIGIFVAGLFYFHRVFVKCNDITEKRTALSAILVIVGLLGSSFTDTPFRLHETRNFLMILLGYSLGYLDNNRSIKDEKKLNS